MSHSDIPLFPAAPASHGSGFTGRDLWRLWFKYWGTIAVAVIAVGALTIYGAAMQPSVYSATAKVWVKTEQQGTPTFLSGVAAYREGQMPDPVNRKIETEMQLLLSRSNVEAVVKKLGIQPENFAGSPIQNLLGSAGKKPRSPEQRLNDSIEAFLKAIKVEAARSKTADTSSNLLEIKLETTDADLTAQALNALVEQYRQYGAALTRQQGQASYALIAEKMKQAQSDLDTLDKRMLKLTIAQGQQDDVNQPVAGMGNATPIEMDEGLRMDTMLGSNRAGGASAVGMIKSQTVALQSKVEELRQLYTDDAEVVRNAKRQLSQAEQRLARSVKAGAELEAKLKQLERTRALAQDRYTELRRKLDQIELYLSSAPDESANRVFTERAQLPDKPEGKKKVVLALIGPLAGLALGLLLAGLREYFDHRLQSAQDVERYLGLETLGVVPDMREARP
jgi:uncharacterized protein involved in exopolysaccharide biosynthesis